MAATASVRKIPHAKLGISEPNPSWFGNPANELNNPNWTNKNWLKSQFHFSFAEYNNPRNVNFGVLRVMNDDLVQPKRGFGEHPHRDAEIMTYIVDGHLTHKDSMGTEETLTRGDLQFMTAGRGVRHSEHNLHATQPLRFIQMWLTTRTLGLPPNYGSSVRSAECRHNRWCHLVRDANTKPSDATASAAHPANGEPSNAGPALCDGPQAETVAVNADVNVYVAELHDSAHTLPLRLRPGRQGYLLCVEGGVRLDSVEGGGKEVALERHDAAELQGPVVLKLTGVGEGPGGPIYGHVLLVEMAHTGPGRTDL